MISMWYDLIKEAEKNAGQDLEEDIEYYLIQMLQRFIDKPDLGSSIVALDYLLAHEAIDSSRKQLLQDVGDKCLLFSGLFPEQALKRRVPVSYFVGLGEAAYISVATFSKDQKDISNLFYSLGDNFVQLMDLLICVREINANNNPINLLQAEELWCNTGSKQALRIIQRYTNGFLVKNFPKK